MKNIIIDSTGFNAARELVLLDWSVSQACQLTNVTFQMPGIWSGHTGISMPENGSPLMINDCSFRGGKVGIHLNTQQYHLKGLKFEGCATGILISSVYDLVIQDSSFHVCYVGIDMGNAELGTLVVLDSNGSALGTLLRTGSLRQGRNNKNPIVLDNVLVDSSSSTVMSSNGDRILSGSITGDAWVLGNSYTMGKSTNTEVTRQNGTRVPSIRPRTLTETTSGKFFTAPPPTYNNYDVTQVLNVKTVPDYPVQGDGKTDDTTNLQQIINSNAGCKILFFPHGTYIITRTLHIPPGTRIVGEVWSALSARGAAFSDEHEPTPMVRVGHAGEYGVAQFSDMLLTVADVLPGCKPLEVNMAGKAAGDVGFWNTHIRVGGAAGSTVQTTCASEKPENCKAAFILAHLTSSSSAYVENMWLWTADHDLDSNRGQTISTGRGLLVEATKGTWLLGIGVEHNTLYQSNFHNAAEVFVGFQQSEAPYWQGSATASTWAPAPWNSTALLPSDPDFSWCHPNDSQCRMALYQRMTGVRALSIYGGGFWTFFNHDEVCHGECQHDAVWVQNASGLSYFGLNTRSIGTMVQNNGKDWIMSADNKGGWVGAVAAFRVGV